MRELELTPQEIIELIRFHGGSVFIDDPESLVPQLCVQVGVVPEVLLDELFANDEGVKAVLRGEWESSLDQRWAA